MVVDRGMRPLGPPTACVGHVHRPERALLDDHPPTMACRDDSPETATEHAKVMVETMRFELTPLPTARAVGATNV